MSKSIQTEHVPDTAVGVVRAGEILRAGGRVAFPTETVFGLGADAKNGAAVASVYSAKGRPSFNPLIVHVADQTAAEELGIFDEISRELANRFWPGPLTLVLPLQPGAGLSSLVTAGLQTVALRVPAHPTAHALLSAFDGPIAAPSANQSGQLSPTRPDHVLATLDRRIEAIIMGNGVTVGLESTIVMPRTDGLYLLRQGGICAHKIESATGHPLILNTDAAAAPNAPGQLLAHYAPRAQLRINATTPKDDELLIGFGARSGAFNLSETGNLEEAAANLFDFLHRADKLAQETGQTIAIAPVPNTGLGAAINDRLRRAASG